MGQSDRALGMAEAPEGAKLPGSGRAETEAPRAGAAGHSAGARRPAGWPEAPWEQACSQGSGSQAGVDEQCGRFQKQTEAVDGG